VPLEKTSKKHLIQPLKKFSRNSNCFNNGKGIALFTTGVFSATENVKTGKQQRKPHRLEVNSKRTLLIFAWRFSAVFT
jgi:hypothetical protein